jgi:hypothetical protein
VLFYPWIRDGKNLIRDEHPRSFFRELRNSFWVKKIFEFFIGNPGFFDPGSGIWDGKFQNGIRDKHPGSAILPQCFHNQEY